MTRPGICQIVPTQDRPDLLRRLLLSVGDNEQYLDQLIVVDGGDRSVEDLCREFSHLPITYARARPPGLVRQRKIGLDMVRDDIDLVGFWDDDLVLEPGCMRVMSEFWQEAGEDVGGAEYNIIALVWERPPDDKIRSFLDRIFLLGAVHQRGRLLKSGDAVTAFPAVSTHEVQWLCGGANLYRREIFLTHSFDDWFCGYGVGDDVDFSYRVSQDHRLYIVEGARVKHLPVSIPPENDFVAGKVMATNQLYFVQKHKANFSRLLAAWSVFGKGMRHIVGGTRRLRKRDVLRGLGYLSPLPSFCVGRMGPAKGQVK